MAEVTGSQTAHDFPCDPCSNEEKEVESVKYCVACQLYLCQKCVDQHQRFFSSKKHDLSDVTKLVPTDRVNIAHLDRFAGNLRHQIPSICCVTRGGTRYTVVSSWFLKKLMVLDESFKVVHDSYIGEKLYGICELPKNGCLAVTARDCTKFFIVEIDSSGHLKIMTSFPVSKSCRGLTAFSEAFSDGLVAVVGATITAYSLGVGFVITKQFHAQYNNKDLKGRSVVINKTKDRVYFTDPDVGVLVADTDGNISIFIDTSKNNLLAGARGLCIDDNDDLYVSGRLSHNVVKYTPEGKLVGEIVTQSHGIKQPISLYFDAVRHYLLIGCDGGADIALFYIDLKG